HLFVSIITSSSVVVLVSGVAFTKAIVFLFSSRRRHTSFSRDWRSDVCSSDLDHVAADDACPRRRGHPGVDSTDRRSEERREGKRVDLGGRRRIKKKKRIYI